MTVEPDLHPDQPAAPSLAELSATNTALVEAYLTAVTGESPECARLDALMQHSSVQLLAAVVLDRFPDARTITIVQNDEVGSMYRLSRVDSAEKNLAGADDYPREDAPIGDRKHAPLPAEIIWGLDPTDDAWAEGITRDWSNQVDGKVFAIDLQAVLDRDAPTV